MQRYGCGNDLRMKAVLRRLHRITERSNLFSFCPVDRVFQLNALGFTKSVLRSTMAWRSLISLARSK